MRNIYYVIIWIIAVFMLSGCIHRELIIAGPDNGASEEASAPQGETKDDTVIPRIAFPEEEYRRLSKSGNATIKGRIYVSDAYGKKIYGKQVRLYLNPVTSYSKQWYSESYIGGYKMEKADKRLYNYLKFTASNIEGKFAFYGVPSGTYYVIGMVKCGKACGYDNPRNIRIAKEVTVSGSETESVDLGKMIN